MQSGCLEIQEPRLSSGEEIHVFPWWDALGARGLTFFSACLGVWRETAMGMVLGTVWGVGLNGHTQGSLACCRVESKQCEIARPQELACAPELPPTERSEGCCTGGSLSFQRNRDRRPRELVSGNHLLGQFASVRPVFHLLTSGY